MKRTINNTMKCSLAVALMLATFACGGGGDGDGGDTGGDDGTSASTSSSDGYTSSSAGNYEIYEYAGTDTASGAPNYSAISDTILEVSCGAGVTSDYAGLEIYCSESDSMIPLICVEGEIVYVDGTDYYSFGCGSSITTSCDAGEFLYLCGDTYYATKDSARALRKDQDMTPVETDDADTRVNEFFKDQN